MSTSSGPNACQLEESMRWALHEWVDRHEMAGILADFEGDPRAWGDLYVRFEGC